MMVPNIGRVRENQVESPSPRWCLQRSEVCFSHLDPEGMPQGLRGFCKSRVYLHTGCIPNPATREGLPERGVECAGPESRVEKTHWLSIHSPEPKGVPRDFSSQFRRCRKLPKGVSLLSGLLLVKERLHL